MTRAGRLAAVLSLVTWPLASAKGAAADGPRPAAAPVWNFQIGDPFPPVVLGAVDGSRVSLPTAGAPTVINFFATWCGPCRMEMPELDRDIARRFAERGVRVFGIDRGEPIDLVRPFAAKLGVGYPLLLDPNKEVFLAISGDGLGIPKTLLLDDKGRIVWRENGFVPGSTIPDLAEQIEMLLPRAAGK